VTEILDAGTEDAETLVVQWLIQLYRTANTRRAGDPLPFVLVQQIPGSKESIEESSAEPLIQLDILCDKAAGEDASRNVKNRVHRRMLLLGRHLEVEGTLDWMQVHEQPFRFPYENDSIIRYTARYRFGQTYDQIDSWIA
jgi:hypothetical protein